MTALSEIKIFKEFTNERIYFFIVSKVIILCYSYCLMSYYKSFMLLGKSDPYCEVSMGAQEHKTKVINNTLNPKWNASMQFTIRDIDMDALCITVFDRDLFSPNGNFFYLMYTLAKCITEIFIAQNMPRISYFLHRIQPTLEFFI